jgi:site-specific DNA-methyltransferase (adenine-specific)
VFVYPRVAPQRKLHPTEKPTAFIRDLIEQSSVPGELVIDPFAGSASTLIAAFECKRQAFGIELDKEYFGNGLLRIERFGKSEVVKVEETI